MRMMKKESNLGFVTMIKDLAVFAKLNQLESELYQFRKNNTHESRPYHILIEIDETEKQIKNLKSQLHYLIENIEKWEAME